MFEIKLAHICENLGKWVNFGHNFAKTLGDWYMNGSHFLEKLVSIYMGPLSNSQWHMAIKIKLEYHCGGFCGCTGGSALLPFLEMDISFWFLCGHDLPFPFTVIFIVWQRTA